MGLKRWTGSGYADVNLAKYGASAVPKNAYVWDGSAYKRVWPIGPQADAKLWMKFDNQANFLENLGTATTPVDVIGGVTHEWDHVRFGSGRLRFTPSTNWYSGFTFSYWTRDTAANSGWETIMHRAVPSGTLTNEAYIVHNTSSTTTTVVSGLKFGSTHREIYSNYSLPVGTDWFHTVVVWQRVSSTTFNVTFYINGVQRGSTNNTGYSSGDQFGSEEVWVGGNRTANEWSGRMDDLTLWDRPLSSAEVTEVYNQGRSFVPQILTTEVPAFLLGTAYSFYFTTDFSATSWSATGLPAGISINSSTGQLTGTPTTETTGTMTVTATGSGGLSAQKNFDWSVTSGVIWIENFSTARTGWDNFATGNSTGAIQSGGAASVASLAYGVSQNSNMSYQNPTMSDDQYLRVILDNPANGNLDTGSSGDPLFLRLRGTQSWGVDGLDFMVRASGEMTFSTKPNGNTVQRARITGGAYGVGDTLRFEVKGNNILVVNESRLVTLISTTIDPSWYPYSGPQYRYAAMQQNSHRPWFQVQWACFGVAYWELGDA